MTTIPEWQYLEPSDTSDEIDYEALEAEEADYQEKKWEQQNDR